MQYNARTLRHPTDNRLCREEEEEMALVKHGDGMGDEEMIIKPQAVTPSVDTSGWPLLLRNWDQCECIQDFLYASAH